MSALERKSASEDERNAVVTKAALNAAERLEISGSLLGEIVGASGPTISRIKNGQTEISHGTKSFELAVLFIRLYRSLDSIMGGDLEAAKQWLRNENTALGGKPITLISSVVGLSRVVGYLDSRRALS